MVKKGLGPKAYQPVGMNDHVYQPICAGLPKRVKDVIRVGFEASTTPVALLSLCSKA